MRCKPQWIVPDVLQQVPEDWPLRQYSRIVRGPVHEWHAQTVGDGPDVLLLHGAGGSVHSFRDLIPPLASSFRVTAIDLPGHGFTRLGAQRRSGLGPMANDIKSFFMSENIRPVAIIGHSAGAAIALQIGQFEPHIRIVGINPALGHFEGIAGVLFPAMAKLLAAMPFTPRLFSTASARPERIKTLIDSTGSKLGADGLALYRSLVARESHVKGALSMMAQWSLDDLLPRFPEIQNEVLFILGEEDTTVPPKVGLDAAAKIRNANTISLGAKGHLVHEESPEDVAQICLDFLRAK